MQRLLLVHADLVWFVDCVLRQCYAPQRDNLRQCSTPERDRNQTVQCPTVGHKPDSAVPQRDKPDSVVSHTGTESQTV